MSTNALSTAADFLIHKFAGSRISRPLFGPSVFRGSHRRSVVLTFDDGPSPSTLPLLENLAKYGVLATFFQCGLNVMRYPKIAQAVAAAGHEIGNHTYSHPLLCPRLRGRQQSLSPAEIYEEIARAQGTLESEVGVSPRLLRVPYGLTWRGVRRAQMRYGLLDVMWTVIGRDWELTSREIASLVLSNIQRGSIICLHDGMNTQPDPNREQMLNAVREIVPRLVQDGYRFETVSQSLVSDGKHEHEQ